MQSILHALCNVPFAKHSLQCCRCVKYGDCNVKVPFFAAVIPMLCIMTRVHFVQRLLLPHCGRTINASPEEKRTKSSEEISE